MNLEEAIGPIIAIAFLSALLLERFFERDRFSAVRWWRLVCLGFFLISGGINVGLPLALGGLGNLQSLLPTKNLPLILQILAGWLAFSFFYYWLHRFEHRVDFLWRFVHQLHHSAERVDIAGFTYVHPLDIMTQTALMWLVCNPLLGLDPLAAAWIGLYTGITSMVQHLNVPTPRFLVWLMQRPEDHLWHHELGKHDGNFSDWPVWDMIFRTYKSGDSKPAAYSFGHPTWTLLGKILRGADASR